MGKFQDLTGQRFGRLTVIEKSSTKQGHHICWVCRCDCGKTVPLVSGDNLKKGDIKSCGCLRREERTKKNLKHGLNKTRTHRIWCGMVNRCFNPGNKSYKDYGGRGITVCDEWKNDFQAFHNWAITHGYSDELTLDRKDTNGNYEPSNCRWITNQEQQSNRRSCHLITYNGETHTLKDWAKIIGIPRSTLSNRINKYKWSVEKALRKKAGN